MKAEGDLLVKVPDYIEAFARKRATVNRVASLDGATGRVLEVEIVDLDGEGGMRPKSLTIAGTLRENGKVVGTITAKRTSTGGAFGFGGVCRTLHRCAKTLGKDVAKWLKAPAMDVNLMN